MFTFNKIRAALAAIILAAFTACISNDLPYPWVLPSVDTIDIESVDADGHELLATAPVIDSVNRTITINLTEWADIQNVVVNGIDLADGTTCVDPQVFDQPLNLSVPVEIELERYERVFTWTIMATQTIDRYFTVASQIGTAEIDAEARTVKALVPMGQPLDNIQVRTLKLAGPLAVMDPDLVGQHVDFTSPVKVNVTEFGRGSEWTITIEQTDVNVFLTRVDAWTNVAWLYGDAEVGKNNGFEYRRADSDEWIVVPSDWITTDGGSFRARVINLDSQTQYVARAISDDEHSAEVEFTTEDNVQLPNSDFSNWWLDGKIWCPWAQDGEQFWCTGNKGAATLGNSNTLPIEVATSPTGYQGAKLETKFVGISILGKLAAGNYFAGDFKKIDGTNGILDFGRPFTNRPTKLRAKLKYTTAAISDASKSNPNQQYMVGQPDTCIVWCALGDWDQPFEIRTNPTNRQLFSPTDEGVIAYGQYQSGNTISDYITVDIELDYKATNRVPKYILVTASASKYGDYFTGARGATLYLESYELLYDY